MKHLKCYLAGRNGKGYALLSGASLVLMAAFLSCSSIHGRAAVGIPNKIDMSKPEAVATLKAIIGEAYSDAKNVVVNENRIAFNSEHFAFYKTQAGNVAGKTHRSGWCVSVPDIVGVEIFSQAQGYGMWVGTKPGGFDCHGGPTYAGKVDGSKVSMVKIFFNQEQSMYRAIDAIEALVGRPIVQSSVW